MKRSVPNARDVQEAVAAYDRDFGHVDADFWTRSRGLRECLLSNQCTPELERFVWDIKCQWGIQGVRCETGPIAAEVLANLDWDASWFDLESAYANDDELFARNLLPRYVRAMKAAGVPRREYSYGSKILHWLMPARMPLYDSAIRAQLGVRQAASPQEAFREIVSWEFAAARELNQTGREWMGSSKPATALRALDKYLWWEGGGRESGSHMRAR